jgi:subtilisin family serine protease
VAGPSGPTLGEHAGATNAPQPVDFQSLFATPYPAGAQAWRDGDRPRRWIAAGPTATGRIAGRVYDAQGRSHAAEVDAHALVQLAPGLSAAQASAILAPLGLAVVRPVSARLGQWLVASAPGTPAQDGAALAQRLSQALDASAAPGVVAAVPDLWVGHSPQSIDIPPNDPRYGGAWFLARVQIEKAWALSTGVPANGGRPASILVVDSGCAVDHPDLAAHFDAGYDAVDRDDDPRPMVGFPGDNHGTAVAGVAAAVTDNGVGVAGTCPECRLRCVRLLPEDGGPVPLSADVAAFDFALETDVDVVNNSWGFTEPFAVPGALARAITAVATEGRGGRGALVVFAAGNDARPINDDELLAVAGVVGVGATNNFDELTQFSNTGRAVDVVAPTGTLSTDLVGADGEDESDYTHRFGGTSSSAPLVSGLFGLLVAAAPEASAAALTEALLSTAQQSLFARPGADGHDVEYGYGVVRPALALRQLLGLPLEDPVPDMGAPDASPADAATDAGLDATARTDAQGGADFGQPEGDETQDDGGCNQGANHGVPGVPGAPWAGLGLLGLLSATRRRRPARPASASPVGAPRRP